MCVMAICMHIPPVNISIMFPKGLVAYMCLLNGSKCGCVHFFHKHCGYFFKRSWFNVFKTVHVVVHDYDNQIVTSI